MIAVQPDIDNDLDGLTAKIRACRICVESPIGRPLLHDPRPILVPSATARILIASQAPGTKAHASGVPFNDASGDRLRDWFGVSRDVFFDDRNFIIAPMGFCFPGQDAVGGDLPPRRECAPAWRAPLLALMPQVDLILTVGLYAQAWHLRPGRPKSLTETVSAWRAFATRNESPTVFPLPHPSWRNTAWIKRNPWFETDLLPFLKREISTRLVAT